MADIFISYARADRQTVRALADALEAAGSSVWWDRNISGGSEFSRMIEQELEAARTVIVAWSATSIESHWVRDEADYARNEGKLLPLSLDGTLPPLGFRQLHALDFSTWDGGPSHAAFEELCATLQGRPAQARSEADEPSPAEPRPSATSRAKTGIAVLPFANMSSDEELEFLADGLTEDLTTDLATNRHFSVAQAASAPSYKGQSSDLREVARALDSRYLVKGSLRKMGQRVRVTVQLVEAAEGSHIWAQRYDLPIEEILESPDELVETISGNLSAHVNEAEADRTRDVDARQLNVWELTQRAAAGIGRGAASVANMNEVTDILETALAKDPQYGVAHALLSWAYNAALINGVYEDGQAEELLAKAKSHLKTAYSLAKNDLVCLTWVGAAENYAGMQEKAVQTLSQVLERNPSNAEAWYNIAMPYAYLGRFDEARAAIGRAKTLSPDAGFALNHRWYHGIIEFLAGNYQEALQLIAYFATNAPAYGYANVLAGICSAEVGNEEVAGRYMAKAREHNPQLSPAMLAMMIMAQPDTEKGARDFATVQRLWPDQ